MLPWLQALLAEALLALIDAQLMGCLLVLFSKHATTMCRCRREAYAVLLLPLSLGRSACSKSQAMRSALGGCGSSRLGSPKWIQLKLIRPLSPTAISYYVTCVGSYTPIAVQCTAVYASTDWHGYEDAAPCNLVLVVRILIFSAR